jgi:hypothetical protein
MNMRLNTLVFTVLTGFSGITFAVSNTFTGKIVIDGQEYSSGSSNVIQGSGKVITDKRKLSAFNKLNINIAADIEYIASDSYRLELTADDNIAATISSAVRGNTLHIDNDRSFSTESKLHARIFGSPALQGVLVDGSSDVNLQGISGNSLDITLDGTGDITAQGNTSNLTIKVDGSGSVNTKELRADNVNINVDGSSEITVTAKKSLVVVIDGVSDVTYYGHPGTIKKTVDGVGDISAGD